MISNFAGCGRCSYFLAGYRVIHGELVLEKAVSTMKINQLSLPWHYDMRSLLVNSYGIHFNVDFCYLMEAALSADGRLPTKMIVMRISQTSPLKFS